MITFEPAELEGIEVWPDDEAPNAALIFCRPCFVTVGPVPLQLLTAITLALEHVRSVHRGAPHSTCIETTGMHPPLPARTFACGPECPR